MLQTNILQEITASVSCDVFINNLAVGFGCVVKGRNTDAEFKAILCDLIIIVIAIGAMFMICKLLHLCNFHLVETVSQLKFNGCF